MLVSKVNCSIYTYICSQITAFNCYDYSRCLVEAERGLPVLSKDQVFSHLPYILQSYFPFVV